QLLLEIPIQSPYVYLRVEGLRLLVGHGDTTTTGQKWELARRYRVRVFVFGHTHEPFLQARDGVVLLNPGSPALPKGDGTPTVALVDPEGVRIVDVRDGRVYRELRMPPP
ncbi:MAG: metallophosphoesterase family protein, partial [Firmicutes bacterium]|nr:metallophosphoesterase family protein [Bacillota bacterium]